MRPGQLELNEFERAILEHLAQGCPPLRSFIPQLRVLSRKLTGVGSYTDFQCPDSASDLGDRRIGLSSWISMPSVPNGLGADLYCEKGRPLFLEIVSNGASHWDGTYKGFSIHPRI